MATVVQTRVLGPTYDVECSKMLSQSQPVVWIVPFPTSANRTDVRIFFTRTVIISRPIYNVQCPSPIECIAPSPLFDFSLFYALYCVLLYAVDCSQSYSANCTFFYAVDCSQFYAVNCPHSDDLDCPPPILRKVSSPIP